MKEVMRHSLASGTDASLWPQPKDRIGEIDFGDDNDGVMCMMIMVEMCMTMTMKKP